MATGTVKWYNTEKGFGFIAQDDGGADLFVHRSAVGWEGISEGDRVQFQIGQGPKGPNAESVTVTERNPNPAPSRERSSSYGSSGGGYGSSSGGYGSSGGGYGGSSSGGGYGSSSSSASYTDVSDLPVQTGTLARFDSLKGFGFITPDNGGSDVFVHQSAFGYDQPQVRDRIEYRLGQGPKGARAEQAKIVN